MVRRGDVIDLGSHRLMCGDSTSETDVRRLMGDDKAVLCHADPPYGMNNKGVTNDNLHREKLDAFQMSWWTACRSALAENASAYIWGKAEDLWRLWYVGGLQESERLTFRNEIVWAKGSAGAAGISHMGADGLRLYPQETERCLFFMRGEQDWGGEASTSPNADNYWEGWEPIRSYLDGERQKMGWDIPTVKRIVGHSDLAGDHWFSRSQWNMPTRKVYTTLQEAARGTAFTADYDALREQYRQLRALYDQTVRPRFDQERWDWQATRAHFDNTHELMTDVWRYPSVKGAERWGHPTPKPIAMMERIVKTSAPEGALVLEPFGGSGSTLIACENTGRICRMMEIDPVYCQVIVDRYYAMARQPRLLDVV